MSHPYRPGRPERGHRRPSTHPDEAPPEMTRQRSSGGSLPTHERPGVPDGRTTILVVEDEVSYQEALLAGLSREGYHVELASDGLEALDHFVKHRPDLVVLDLLLPTM